MYLAVNNQICSYEFDLEMSPSPVEGARLEIV